MSELAQQFKPLPISANDMSRGRVMDCYPQLSGLRLALDRFRTDEKITMLDYACGGSPYRRVFPNATYLRADIPGATDLICSTYGMFEEHGCPYDFRDWTVGGLRQLLEKVGLTVKEVSRVTTGPRALISFIDLNYSSIRGPEKTLFCFLAAAARYVYAKIRHHLHWQAGKFLAENRIAAESDGRHATYICVLADCRKPA